METWHWIGEILQNIGIIAGLFFTVHTLRRDAEARRISNMLSIGQQHQAIWKQLRERKELRRITEARAVLDTKPPWHEQRLFVTQLVLHLDAVNRAMKARMMVNMEGLRKDVKDFFALPIPKAVWEQLKPYQDRDFVAFVEACRREG